MIRTLTTKYGTKLQHDDEASECTIRANVANFFNCKHGERETFSFYRGFVIVRSTPRNTERRTVLYAYIPNLEGRSGTLRVDFDGNSVKQAKSRIDRILETGLFNP